MSCSFWLRRHKAAAKKRRENERLKAEVEEQKIVEETEKMVKKPVKKAVKSDDNEGTV